MSAEVTEEYTGIGLEYNGQYWGIYSLDAKEGVGYWWTTLDKARLFHPNKFARHIDISIFNDYKMHTQLTLGRLVKVKRIVKYEIQDFNHE